VIRLAPVALGAFVFVIALMVLADVRRSRRARAAATETPAAQRKPLIAPRQRHYDYERKADQLYRRVKSVPAPPEDRDGILAFIETRSGVQAWVEPRTVMHPLSVVLVAEDGEWKRFELRDDAYLRELARERGLAIHDAMRVGYPERMRTYDKRKDPGA
jgi:hypothetical protein